MDSVVNGLSGNDQRASGCNLDLMHKVDELTTAFHKMTHGFTESYEFMSQHFKSCSKLIDEIRALQFALGIPVVPNITQDKDGDIEMAMKKMVTVVKDPVSRFRLLDILGRLVLLCCLCCIYTRQKTGLLKTKSLLAVLDQLLKAVGKSVLEEVVPYRRGLILCKHDSKLADVVSICVGDVVRLVTLSSQLTVEDGSVKHKEWQWLDTFLQCKKLITTEQYILAMKKLEIELSKPLDPEVKAILLCQFAKCYQKQGCPQLAIQTYKDALHIYKDHYCVLLHLANIYDIVGQQELQLEILNLLVKVLSAKSARNERPVFATDFETIVISVFQIIPKVSLLSAVYHLAKCCTKLHRYKEAADHYLKLLDLLKNIENFTLESTSDEPLLNTDVKELVVETIETLALAQRNNKCLLLCDEFYPILSTDGTLPHLSQHMELHTHKEDSAHSLHSLFSLSQHSESPDEIINCSLEHQASSSSFSPSTKHKSNDSVSLTSGILGNLTSLSRKRSRSTSFDKDADSHKNIDEDIWSSKCLPVRLLLSKADALVATQGYTDEIVACLKMASNLMMTSDTSIFVQDSHSLYSTSQPPLKKSKFSNSDNETSEATNLATKLSPSEQIESCSEFKVSKTWANCMIKLGLRMAKAWLERLQMSSVLNSCHLVLQLAPRNISAHYLKTVALQKLGHQKYKASKQWLQARGIDNSAETALPLIVEEKQKKIREKQEERNTPSNPWWEISELCLLNLDVVSLNNITEHFQNRLKAS